MTLSLTCKDVALAIAFCKSVRRATELMCAPRTKGANSRIPLAAK